MKKRTILIGAIVLAMVVAVVVGCKKEQENNNTAETVTTEKNVSKGMLRISSAEEFAEVQQKVLAMGEDERREWERQQGFKSFATKCNELFEELEAKGITSDEDIYNFVKENPDYFYIREEDGEKYLTSYMESSPFYHFANTNRMLVVNKQAIKVYEEGFVFCSIQDAEELMFTASFSEAIKNEKFDARQNKTNDRGSLPKIIRRATNGNNRTLIEIALQDQPFPMHPWTVKFLVRPYHKVLGIWYWCIRHMEWSVEAEWEWKQIKDYENTGYYYDDGESNSKEAVYGSSVERFLGYIGWVNISYNDFFVRYSGWGKTPSTDAAVF